MNFIIIINFFLFLFHFYLWINYNIFSCGLHFLFIFESRVDYPCTEIAFKFEFKFNFLCGGEFNGQVSICLIQSPWEVALTIWKCIFAFWITTDFPRMVALNFACEGEFKWFYGWECNNGNRIKRAKVYYCRKECLELG